MTEQQEICQDCWGSGRATQFVTPCPSCKGTGRILPSPLPHQDGASAEDVIKATIMGYVDPNNVAKISGELMRVFQSETAKVVAEKDKYIRQVQIGMQSVINMQEAEKEAYKRDLSTSNAHRTRLIESVKKWGGAWRTCRAELKEAKERIKELKEINRTQATWLMEAVMTDPEQKEWVEQHKIL